jgi:uncharacterized protein (TIGR00369 family)
MTTSTATASHTPEETLQRWRDEEAAVRARAAKVGGVARPDQVLGKPGMAFFDALFAGEVPLIGIGLTMDFIALQVQPGLAIFQGRPGPQHYNPMGTVHGGWYATLLDSALGCCIHAGLPAGKGFTTLELKVNMIRALTDKVPLVRAEGRVIHQGGQTATSEARLVGADGKLYAHGSSTCLIFDMPAKPRPPV